MGRWKSFHSEAKWLKNKNKYFLLKWRHVNHQATLGLLSLSQIRHIIHRFKEGGVVVVISNILLLADVNFYFLSPSTDAAACFFRRVWPDPKRPLLRPFSLCYVNLYFSSHREASPGRAKAVFGSLMSLNKTRYPGDMGGNSSVICPRLVQVTLQTAVKSLSFLYSLWIRMVDYGYMCMIHEHTAVFSITDPTDSRLFLTADRPRLLRSTGGEDENRSFAVLLWIIFAPFFLSELYIEIDSVEEVGWGKRLSRNPEKEPWSSSTARIFWTSCCHFHNKAQSNNSPWQSLDAVMSIKVTFKRENYHLYYI